MSAYDSADASSWAALATRSDQRTQDAKPFVEMKRASPDLGYARRRFHSAQLGRVVSMYEMR
jgi:indole-3-glycerol phosphate synthase